MSKTISRLLLLPVVTMLLAGCVFVINTGKPTGDEQALMDIQNQASREVAGISQKIQTGNYSADQLKELVTQAKKVVDDNLQKINGLKLPERAKELANKTKEYLQKAEQTYLSFLQMSNQANEKVQEMANNLKTMSEPLINMAKQMEEMKVQFLTELQKAAAVK